MTKIEGINSMVQAVFGTGLKVESNGSGQCYSIAAPGYGLIWVDVLRGGRVSIKIKYFSEWKRALDVSAKMWYWLCNRSGIVVDAAAKADTYMTYHPRFGGPLFAARLKCDKWW